MVSCRATGGTQMKMTRETAKADNRIGERAEKELGCAVVGCGLRVDEATDTKHGAR